MATSRLESVGSPYSVRNPHSLHLSSPLFIPLKSFTLTSSSLPPRSYQLPKEVLHSKASTHFHSLQNPPSPSPHPLAALTPFHPPFLRIIPSKPLHTPIPKTNLTPNTHAHAHIPSHTRIKHQSPHHTTPSQAPKHEQSKTNNSPTDFPRPAWEPYQAYLT